MIEKVRSELVDQFRATKRQKLSLEKIYLNTQTIDIEIKLKEKQGFLAGIKYAIELLEAELQIEMTLISLGEAALDNFNRSQE